MEPDCLIKGTRWHEELVHAVEEEKYWMAGLFKRSHGPVHPCPSIWLVNKLKFSFESVPKNNDVFHPRFTEVFSIKKLAQNLAKENHSEDINRFCFFMWDTGFKNWFDMAVQNKAKHISMTNQDFVHFWHGSERQPKETLPLKLI
jgi:hypothetical protein